MNDKNTKATETPAGAASALSAGLGAWSPIETAPKDGTSILAWSPEYGQRQTRMSKYGKGSPGFAEWERGDGPLNSGWEWYEPRSGWISSWSPTYWMPLPEAPNTNSA